MRYARGVLYVTLAYGGVAGGLTEGEETGIPLRLADVRP